MRKHIKNYFFREGRWNGLIVFPFFSMGNDDLRYEHGHGSNLTQDEFSTSNVKSLLLTNLTKVFFFFVVVQVPLLNGAKIYCIMSATFLGCQFLNQVSTTAVSDDYGCRMKLLAWYVLVLIPQ